MLRIDVISAFVISGAGSFVAAGMALLARPTEMYVRDALNICSAAFLVFGISMTVLVTGVDGAQDPRMLVCLTGTAICVALFTWGLARLGQYRVRPAVALALTAALLPSMSVAWQFGPRVFELSFLGVNTAIASAAVVLQRPLILRPANLAERVLGLSVTVYLLSWIVRLALALDQAGPIPAHYLHMSDEAMPVYAIYYGVTPIFIAMVLFSVINARLNQQLTQLAMTDELTGLTTRRALRDLSWPLIEKAKERREPVAVFLLDLDHFKAINDRFGHLAGDHVLRTTADTVRRALRADALCTRYGGEEFALLLPVATAQSAQRVAERLRRAIATRPIRHEGADIPVTASIGIALLGDAEPLESGLRRADEAMYRAKLAGRNRAELAACAAIALV